MSRVVYVNGDFVDQERAKISVFDRGFLFADAVYEVTTVINGRLVDNEAHLDRLDRSLAALNLVSPWSRSQLTAIQMELVERNSLAEGVLYLQISRGAAERDFNFPANPSPSLVMFTQAKAILAVDIDRSALSIVTLPDLRWGRRDIKTVGLLYPSMAKSEAKRSGADDAWLLDDSECVTEATSSNAFILTDENQLITRNLNENILHGITRAAVLALAAESGVGLQQRPFTLDELYRAKEAFSTSASTFVMPVVEVNGRAIGNGKVGPIARKLRELYIEFAST